ncbi:MAG: hypothetical protein Q9170_003153 [Blastenia crenularia]
MATTSPELAAPTPIKVGDKFPEGVVFSHVPYTAEKESITACGIPQNFEASKEFANKKVVLFAVPGAFTPGCSVRHLPGFIDHLSEIKAKGVDLVVVLAFNDAWVMSAWSKANGIKDEMHKTLDVITLFHKASSPASVRAQTLLKQVSAHASETATEDQATDHTHQNKLQRTEFDLDVTEDPPTSDQLRTILDYVGSGAGRVGQIVEGAVDEADALKKLKEDPNRFQRPVIVDWNNGRAVFGDKESDIMKMISQLPKETNSIPLHYGPSLSTLRVGAPNLPSIMADSNTGEAIFSTELGRFAPRGPKLLPSRIILRTSPDEDMDAMITDLRAKYPAQCKAMPAPNVVDLHGYFDSYDQQLHGALFLRAVLIEIYLRNGTWMKAVLDYAEAWVDLNPTAFEYIIQYELNAFSEDDVKEYGEEFLQDALRQLLLRKSKQEAAVALAEEKARIQQASRRPILVFPHQHEQVFAHESRRNYSGPSHAKFAQPQSTASVPSSTPRMVQTAFQQPSIPPPLPRLDDPNARPVEPPFRSAPLYPSRRDHYSDPTDSGINVPRPGYSDTVIALPPPAPMTGPFTLHRMPAGPRAIHYPANQSRTLPRTRGPVYVGPSNDARVLEKQGVPRHRGSSEAARMNWVPPHPYGQQVPYHDSHQPVQQSQPYGASAEVPRQGTMRPSQNPANFAHSMVPLESRQGSIATEQVSLRVNQHALARPHLDRLRDPNEQEYAIPHPPFTAPPRRLQDTFYEPHTVKHNAFPDLTPPHRAQRKFEALPSGSPKSHRFSDASNGHHEMTPRARNTGEYQYTPGSRSHRDRDLPLSDRKVWIGGLLPTSDVGILTRLLEPWAPVSVGKVHVSYRTINSRLDSTGPAHYGYTFAEFEKPHQATDAIKALNGQYVDDLKRKISLRLAYERSIVDQSDSSPKKNDARTNRYSLLTDSGHEEQERPVPMDYHIDAQSRFSAGRRQSHQGSQERGRFSAEWPALRANAEGSDLASKSSNILQPSTSENPLNQGIPPSTSAPDEDGKANARNVADAQGQPASPISTKTTKEVPHRARSAASKTPSPKKTKGRNAAKDGSADGKISQAKQRKEMLSGLRTEKLNAATSTMVPRAPVPEDDPQACNVNDTSAVGDKIKTAIEEGFNVEKTSISHPSRIKPTQQMVSTRSDNSSEQVSPAHNASAHWRTISSASGVISTDPTSYAQSENSESGAVDIHSELRQDKDLFPQTTVNPSKEVVESTKRHVPVDVVGSQITPDISMQTLVQPAKSEASSPDTIPVPDEALIEISSADPEPAVNIEGDITLPANDGEPSSSARLEKIAPVQPKLNEEPRPQVAEALDIQASKQPQGPVETSGRGPVRSETLMDDHAKPSAHAPPDASKSPSLDKPVTKSPPAQRRGLSKDPKVLIAVPKVLPLVRHKRQPQEANTQGSEPLMQPTVSAELPNNSTHAVVDKVFLHENSQSKPSTPQASLATVKEELPTSKAPIAQAVETSSENLITKNQTTDATKDARNENEDNHDFKGLVSRSDSTATLEDDRLDPDTSTPQSFAAALTDRANKSSDVENQPATIEPPEQQPVVQQKKKKAKKGKKKPKKSKASQADSVDGSSIKDAPPGAVENKKQSAKAVQVETPFLSDDKQPLPRPIFNNGRTEVAPPGAIQNKEQSAKVVQVETPFLSDDKQPLPWPTFDIGRKKNAPRTATENKEQGAKAVQVETPFLSDDKQPLPRPTFAIQNHSSMNPRYGDWYRSQREIPAAYLPAAEAENGNNYTVVFIPSTYAPSLSNPAAKFRALMVFSKDDDVQSDAASGAEPSTEPPSESRTAEDIDLRNRGGEALTIDIASEHSEPPDEVDEATRHARVKLIEEYLEKNGMHSVGELQGALNFFAPRKSMSAAEDSSPPANTGFAVPRVEEVYSDDEVEPLTPPTPTLKHREQRMLPSRDVSPAPVSNEECAQGSDAAKKRSEHEERLSGPEEHISASFPSTRRTSPTRGRFRSEVPPVGPGLSIPRPSSANVEDLSRARQPRKSLSYKQVASTPPMQPGEIVEIVSKDPGHETKEGRGVTVIRKAGGKDPWRVPSSEQPWGGSNKILGPSETSEAPK